VTHPHNSADVLERKEQILAPLDPERYTALMRLVAAPQHRIVASFGGGSVPGLCGNLAFGKILEELGIDAHVDEVWGTSAGAAIGGPWASGTPIDRVYESVASLNRKGSVDVPWARLAIALLLKPFGHKLPNGLIRGEYFARAIDNALTAKTFEDCPRPFRCIACTDDGRCMRKVFRRGPLLSAIFQSMSIPGIVIPRQHDGEETGFYDGGLVEKTPLISPIAEHNRRHPDKKLILIGTHFGNDPRPSAASGFLMRFLVSINALENLAWEYQIREVRETPNVDLLILNPRIDDPALFDFSRVERNYLRAREVLSDTLQNAKLALAFGVR